MCFVFSPHRSAYTQLKNPFCVIVIELASSTLLYSLSRLWTGSVFCFNLERHGHLRPLSTALSHSGFKIGLHEAPASACQFFGIVTAGSFWSDVSSVIPLASTFSS